MTINTLGNSYGYYGSMANASTGVTGSTGADAIDPAAKTGKPGKVSETGKCETCENRKYQDGSDEMVSFKSAAKISPEAAAGTVRSHEQEHVRNAYTKAEQGGGKVLSASVAIKTSICPDCGSSYVAGGTTSTKIRYGDESNPYQQNRKLTDAALIKGMNFDKAV